MGQNERKNGVKDTESHFLQNMFSVKPRICTKCYDLRKTMQKRTIENNSLLFSRTIAFCSTEQYPMFSIKIVPPKSKPCGEP